MSAIDYDVTDTRIARGISNEELQQVINGGK